MVIVMMDCGGELGYNEPEFPIGVSILGEFFVGFKFQNLDFTEFSL